MNITKKDFDDYTLIEIHGSNTIELTYLKKIFEEVLEAKRKKVILSLKDVSYMNSSIIGAIVRFDKHLKKQNLGTLILGPVSKVAKNIFHLLEIDDYFIMSETIEQAIDKIKEIK